MGAQARARLWGVLIVAAALGLAGMQAALADGAYIPDRAYKKLPAIPAQRAFIGYRDGKERLIVESALDAEGQQFGWIIPVPSRPTEFARVSPGFLKTLSQRLQPKITHDLHDSVQAGVFIAVVVGVWACWVLSRHRHQRHLAGDIVALVVMLVLACMFLPTLSRGRAVKRSGAQASVRVEETARVGSYDVAVLEADDAEALDAWLEENDLAQLPAPGVEIARDYIRDGWHFVVARLRREGSGLSVPHPIAMTFAAAEPVYPMRLTALAGSDTYLELFVAAEQQASAPGTPLRAEFCDRYRYRGDLGRNYEDGSQSVAGFQSETFRADIGHPAAAHELWDGCCLTKLTGTFSPDDMSSDIRLDWEAAGPSQRHHFSRKGAWHVGVLSGLVVWSVGLPLIMIGLYPLIRRGSGPLRGALCTVLPVAAASALVACGFYLVVPKLDVVTLSPRDYRYYRRGDLYSTVRVHRDSLTGETVPQIKQSLEGIFERWLEPALGRGLPVLFEDSPGNWTLAEDERGIVFSAYDEAGFPHELLLRPGAAQPQ